MKIHLLDKLRAWPWLLGALVATLVVAVLAPYQIGVLVWSLSKLSLGACLGYWIDRSVFHYARPHTLAKINLSTPYSHLYCAAMMRRAVVMAAAILALGLRV